MSLREARIALRRLENRDFFAEMSGTLTRRGGQTPRSIQRTQAQDRVTALEEQIFARGSRARDNLALFFEPTDMVSHVQRVLPRVRRESSRVKRNTGFVTPVINNPFAPR